MQDKSVAWDRLERHIADEIAFWSKPESRYQRLIDASNAALRNAEKKALADYRAKVQDFENRKARNAGDSLPLK